MIVSLERIVLQFSILDLVKDHLLKVHEKSGEVFHEKFGKCSLSCHLNVDYHTFAKHNDPRVREIFNGILPKCVRALSIV